MNHRLRKKVTYFTIGFYYFCSGLEYAVIFPTIWTYLQSLGARNENLLGMAVAAFSVSSLVFSPLVGKWFDRTQNAKQILIILNIFEIGGGVLYFFASNPLYVVLSRFISGLGGCAATAVMADVTQCSTVQSRTAVMSSFQASRQIGLLVGPALNLVLREINFSIGGFSVNQLTVPGLFMALLGCIAELLFFFAYFNLAKNQSHQRLCESLRHNYGISERARREHHFTSSSVNSEHDRHVAQPYLFSGESEYMPSIMTDEATGDCRLCHSSKDVVMLTESHGSNAMMENAERRMGVVCRNPNCMLARPLGGETSERNSVPDDYYVTSMSSYNAYVATSCDAENNFLGYRSRWSDYCEDFLRDEVVALLGLAFISFYAQTVLETIVTPLTQQFYNFGELENSLLFLFAGLEILAAFVSISFLSKVLQDRTLILVGSSLMAFSLCWYLAFVPSFQPGDWSSLPYFCVGIFANLLGISLLMACCVSLFSKLISRERQGLGHGIRRTMLSAGMILGPLWGGATTDRLYVLFSVPLVLVVLFTILFLMSFRKLVVHSYGDASFVSSINQGSVDSKSHEDDNDERSPLLSSRS